MRQYDRTYARINLDVIEANMRAMRAHVRPETKIIGVVKADGYGHGAVPAAEIISPYVDGYAVATADEGIQLRRHGIKKEILVLGVVGEFRYEELLDYDLTSTVFQYESAKKLSEQAMKYQGKAHTVRKDEETAKARGECWQCKSRKEGAAKIHIAVDTGMSRIGLFPDEDGAREVKQIAALPGIRITGMYTHFARADETDKTDACGQAGRFEAFCLRLKEEGVQIPLCHCSNSAAILDMENVHMDAVRAGISIYGLYPSSMVNRTAVFLTPAMELKSVITYIKTIEAGTSVSYGGTFTAKKPTRVATVAAGYGDGYPRNLSGKGEVLIHGKRAPILGRICMDQFMVDVTHIPEAAVWDQVTLAGRDGEEEITMDELAKLSGGFHYEIPCVIGKRVPRIYIRGGRIIGAVEYFDGEYQGF